MASLACLVWSSLSSLQIIWPRSPVSATVSQAQVSCLYEGQSVPLFYFQVQCQLLAGFIVGNFSYFPVGSTLSLLSGSNSSVNLQPPIQLQSSSVMRHTRGKGLQSVMLKCCWLISFLFISASLQGTSFIDNQEPTWELSPYCFYSTSFSVQILPDRNLMFFFKSWNWILARILEINQARAVILWASSSSQLSVEIWETCRLSAYIWSPSYKSNVAY